MCHFFLLIKNYKNIYNQHKICYNKQYQIKSLRKSKVNILKSVTEKIAKLRAIYTKYIEISL